MIYNVSRTNFTTANNLREHSFFGHNTISGLIINSTPRMTFLAYLRNLENNFSDFQSCANRQINEVNSFSRYILSKVSFIDIEAQRLHFLYTCHGQQAHLSVPVAGMSVALDTEI